MKRHSNIHESQREKYGCVNCGKMCVSKQAHKAHWSRNHGTIQFKHPVKKIVENSITQISSSVSLHFCDYCKKGFIRKDNLSSHMQTHGFFEKKFECIVCKKQFAHSSNLKVHLRLHETKKSETGAENEVCHTLILRFSILLFPYRFTITDLICKAER